MNESAIVIPQWFYYELTMAFSSLGDSANAYKT